MTTKPEAQPKVPAEAAPASSDAREGREESVEGARNDEGSVAPKLPTSEQQGPRRSGAV